jgi:tRNA threonylcarbamoyladenosine biosynthesis protein TsaB
MILGVDTAGSVASAALMENGQLIAEEIFPPESIPDRPRSVGKTNHAETILPLVETLLKKSGVALAQITAFAVSQGPGSFTGLRIGLSTIKGLAFGLEASVVGVPTLLAIATQAPMAADFVCPILDAKKNEIYIALFSRKNEGLERVTADLAGPPDLIPEILGALHNGESCIFMGEGARIHADLVTGVLGGRALFAPDRVSPSVAAAVCKLGEEKVRRGERDSAASLAPIYVRPSGDSIKHLPY